jgi:hypothetical protein
MNVLRILLIVLFAAWTSHANKISLSGETTSDLRLCEAQDLAGTWLMVDQIILEQSHDSPKYDPLQALIFKVDYSVRSISEKNPNAFKSKMESEKFTGETYEVKWAGRLLIYDSKHELERNVVCRIVTSGRLSPLSKEKIQPNDMILAEFYTDEEGVGQINAQQLFRRVQKHGADAYP